MNNQDISSSPSNDAWQHLERAYASEEQGEFDKALEECGAAIELDPHLAEAHNLRGIILEELGRQEEAVSAYRQAVSLDPDLHEAKENVQEIEAELRRDELESFRGCRMNTPTPGKPLLVSILQFLIYTNIISGILGIPLRLIDLFRSRPSADRVLSAFLSILVSGLIVGCLWLLDLMVRARLRMARVGLAILVVVAYAFSIFNPVEGGPIYQEAVQRGIPIDRSSYAAGRTTGNMTRGILGVMVILYLQYDQNSKNYFASSLAERKHSKSRIGWGFELQWMLASTIGWAVSVAASAAVNSVLSFALGVFDTLFNRPQATGPPLVFILVSGAAMGVVVGSTTGLAQWFALRRRIGQAGWWILATTVGVSSGFLALAVIRTITGALIETMGAALIGIVAGIAQWFVLRRRVSRAGWWVLASIVSWVAGLFFSHPVPAGTSFGLITGTALVWLLRHPASETADSEQGTVIAA